MYIGSYYPEGIVKVNLIGGNWYSIGNLGIKLNNVCVVLYTSIHCTFYAFRVMNVTFIMK